MLTVILMYAIVSPDFTETLIENQVRLMKYRRTIDLRIGETFKPVEFNSHNPLAREIMRRNRATAKNI